MEYRNVSPPPDSIESDFIGNTLYSRITLIELLKRILNKLVYYCSSECIDIDGDLEFDDDLCKFMDTTVEKEVLDYIKDFTFVEPFCDAICVNKSDRFNELFIGILSNFASNETLCDKISENEDIVKLLVSFWSSSSLPFLLECNRMLKMVFHTSSKLNNWLSVIKSDSQILASMIFILRSSLNNDLLISTVQIIGQLMKLDDDICDKWICPELLSAILVARSETQWVSDQDLDYFHYLIHLFSTNETGVVSLISNFAGVYSIFSEYLNKVCDEEPHLIMVGQYHNGLRLMLPTVNVTVSNMAPAEALELLQTEPSLLENLVRLVYSCTLSHSSGTTPSVAVTAPTSTPFDSSLSPVSAVQQVYLEISSFFNTVINITHAVVTQDEQKQSPVDPVRVRWLRDIDVGACLPQLRAFLSCCTQHEPARRQMEEISHMLSLTYLEEALAQTASPK